MNEWYDPLEVWQRWAGDVTGRAVDCGHFIAEERPAVTAHLLSEFLLTHLGSSPVPDSSTDRL